MGYSQEDVAERVGVARQNYHRWEIGKNSPSNDMVVKLARLFHTTTDYLLGESDEQTADIAYDDLAPDEKLLIDSYRSGKIWPMLRLITELAPEVTKDIAHINQSDPLAKDAKDLPGERE